MPFAAFRLSGGCIPCGFKHLPCGRVQVGYHGTRLDLRASYAR